jgi:hypothetical protein
MINAKTAKEMLVDDMDDVENLSPLRNDGKVGMKEIIVKMGSNGQLFPVRELIRCKDCKKRNTWECWQYFFGRMNLPDDYYCADGEPKEGDQK